MLELKNATTDDLVAISAWLKSTAECSAWAGGRVGYPIQSPTLASDIQWPIARSLGLYSNQDIRAFGQIVPKANDRLHLARLIVDPSMRGKGLGRELALRLLKEASSANSRTVSLNVSRDNPPAVSLYVSLGFVEAERPPDEARSTSLYMEHR